MADLPTYADLFHIGRDEMLARNTKLTAEVIEREGSDANVLVAVSAAMADEIVRQLADVEAGRFLDSATGSNLVRLALQHYGIVPKQASCGYGTATFSVPVAAVASFPIPDATKLTTSDGIEHITIGAAVFPVGATQLVVPIRSVLAGAAQRARAGTITAITGTVPGAPAGFAVTNEAATAGADDAETEDRVRARCRLAWATSQRATKSALEAAALAVGGIRSAVALDVIDSMGRPARLVQLIVADAATEAGTPSQYLAAVVYNALQEHRAWGIFVDVKVATVVIQGVQLNLAFQAGVDVVATTQNARGAVVATINALNSGATMKRADLHTALSTVPGLAYTGNEVAVPAGDVIPKTHEVIRTTLDSVTAYAGSAVVQQVGAVTAFFNAIVLSKVFK